MKTKQISYAYATSPYAKQYGCYNDGCFVVEIINTKSTQAIGGGFKTVEEAKVLADTLDYPYNRYSLRKAI